MKIQIKILNLLLLWSAISPSNSQNQIQLDSILKQLKPDVIDSFQMVLNHQVGDYYTNNNKIKAIDYFSKALHIATELNLKEEMASFYYTLGFCYFNNGDFDDALENYHLATKLYEELGFKRRLTNSLISIATLHAEFGNLDKSKEYFDKAEQLIEITQDTFEWLTYLAELGTFYYKQSKFDSAIQVLKKAYQLAVLSNDNQMIPINLLNIGLMYKKLGLNELALTYTDSALHFFSEHQPGSNAFASTFNNLGSIYAQMKEYNKAEAALNKSLKYCIEGGHQSIEMENYLNLAEMFEMKQDWLNYSKYLKKYYTLKDSLYTAENNFKLTELEADYQIERRNKVILEKSVEVNRKQNERNLFIVIAFASLLLFGLMILAYRNIKKKKQIVESQNKLINQQKDELNALNQLKDRLFSIISHDLRNPITTLRSYFLLSDNESILADKKLIFKNKTLDAIVQTGDLLDNLLAWANIQLKDTQAKIVPIVLKDCVDDVISVLNLQASQKKINLLNQITNVIVPADLDILSIALRNLITNAIKFSKENQNVNISVNIDEQHTYINVQDQGVGMTEEMKEQILQFRASKSQGTMGEIGSGLGLFFVAELLQRIDGELLVESKLNVGSKFIIKLPKF